MKVVVTAGPSYEPIDEVRCLTNFSTGELGALLADQLALAGFEVVCLRGTGATYPAALDKYQHQPFTTNDDLLARLAKLSHAHEIAAVFHAAALCDFTVQRVGDVAGKAVESPKIESRSGGLTLHLEPAKKIIRELRGLFPRAVIVGWKYELNGARADALTKAWQQIEENHTDACVLNGRAWGNGFAFCRPPNSIRELGDKAAVAGFLPGWLKEFRRTK
jgi:phosphopantothenoylcysteine synthetase/decarboxylase